MDSTLDRATSCMAASSSPPSCEKAKFMPTWSWGMGSTLATSRCSDLSISVAGGLQGLVGVQRQDLLKVSSLMFWGPCPQLPPVDLVRLGQQGHGGQDDPDGRDVVQNARRLDRLPDRGDLRAGKEHLRLRNQLDVGFAGRAGAGLLLLLLLHTGHDEKGDELAVQQAGPRLDDGRVLDRLHRVEELLNLVPRLGQGRGGRAARAPRVLAVSCRGQAAGRANVQRGHHQRLDGQQLGGRPCAGGDAGLQLCQRLAAQDVLSGDGHAQVQADLPQGHGGPVVAAQVGEGVEQLDVVPLQAEDVGYGAEKPPLDALAGYYLRP